MTIQFFGSQSLPNKKILHQFSLNVLKLIGLSRSKGEICVLFVSDKKIREINKKYLGKNKNTDVIAFNYDVSNQGISKSADPLPFGDITISLESARHQARRGNHAFQQELALLILHGLLHLIGYEDSTVTKRSRMFRKQTQIFRKIDPQLAPPDFR